MYDIVRKLGGVPTQLKRELYRQSGDGLFSDETYLELGIEQFESGSNFAIKYKYKYGVYAVPAVMLLIAAGYKDFESVFVKSHNLLEMFLEIAAKTILEELPRLPQKQVDNNYKKALEDIK
jgi:hypothetical protein